MTDSALFLGLDVAQEHLGLVLITAGGEVVGAITRSYGSGSEESHDAQNWWRAARTGIKDILRRTGAKADTIRCIGITGSSRNIVNVGEDGQPLCPTLPGDDPRACEAYDQLLKTVGVRNFSNITGSRPSPTGGASKLVWLRTNEPRVWHDTRFLLPPKDFLRFKLTDNATTDAYDASATQLYNPKTRTWSKQLVQQLGVDPNWLPPVNSAQLIAGRVTTGAARDTGLRAGTPVLTGVGQVAAAAIAAGAIGPNHSVIELGNNGAFFATTAQPLKDNSGFLTLQCHGLNDVWAMERSGIASDRWIAWIADRFAARDLGPAKRRSLPALDLLAESAAEIAPGAEGLTVLQPDPLNGHAGSLIGLAFEHDRRALIRASLESSALLARRSADAMAQLNHPIEQVALTGPAADSTLWCQMFADALAQPIKAVPCEHAAAVGTVVLASIAIGAHKHINQALKALTPASKTYKPRIAATEAYEAMLPGLAKADEVLQDMPQNQRQD